MQIPVSPPVLVAESRDRCVILRWSVTSATGISGYTLYRDYVVLANLTADATSYTNHNLDANTTYNYHLVAEALTGHLASSSNIIEVKTLRITSPSIPRELNVILDIDNGKAEISWLSPADFGNSDYITYDYSVIIEYDNGENTLNSENNTKHNKLNIDHLPGIVGYDISVRANNGIYVSNWISTQYGNFNPN